MIILIILFWITVIVMGVMVAVRVNTAKLNNLRRPDGSYADYDFPGILNDGKPVEFAEPDLKGPGPHQRGETAGRDLYGRPLPRDVAEKRAQEARNQKQTVFVLQYTTDKDTESKLLGVYGSRDSANAAIGRYRQLEGFAQYPDGFHLDQYELDKDDWDA